MPDHPEVLLALVQARRQAGLPDDPELTRRAADAPPEHAGQRLDGEAFP